MFWWEIRKVGTNRTNITRRYLFLGLQQKLLLTLYTLKSVCIFSILLFIHFLRYRQGEFVYQSKASVVSDHFLYSHDLNVWLRDDNVRRNLMPVTLRVKSVKVTTFARSLHAFPEAASFFHASYLHLLFRGSYF